MAFIKHSEIVNGEKMEVIEKIKEISKSTFTQLGENDDYEKD